MALKRSKSHRKSPKLKQINKKKAKAQAKRMKKLPKKKPKKDPGIPNLYPFKNNLLRKLIKSKNNAMAQKDLMRKLIKSQSSKISENSAEMAKKGEGEINAVKSQIPAKNKKFSKMLSQVIEDSDVVLFVLDARDPEGCRNKELEAIIGSKESNALEGKKRLVLVINKIDLVPATVTNDWIAYLRRELPTIAFKATTQNQKTHLGTSNQKAKDISSDAFSTTKLSVGCETLFSLLKTYASGNGKNKKSINVGVVGYPNVGKSSVINSLKRKKIASTSPVPGHTKEVQRVVLDKRLNLLDSPGVIFSEKTNYANLVLKNSIKVEKLKAPEDFVSQILKKCPAANLCEIYKIPLYSNSEEFLFHVANVKGMMKKGGTPNTDAAARAVVRDWNTGKIAYYTEPPKAPLREGDEVVILGESESQREEEIKRILAQSANDVTVTEMRGSDDVAGDNSSVPMKQAIMEDD